MTSGCPLSTRLRGTYFHDVSNVKTGYWRVFGHGVDTVDDIWRPVQGRDPDGSTKRLLNFRFNTLSLVGIRVVVTSQMVETIRDRYTVQRTLG